MCTISQIRTGVAAASAAVVCLLPIWPAARATGEASPGLTVMSFNVRYSIAGAGEQKTENNWSDPVHPRRERVIRVIRDYGPDLLGVQEARDAQIKDLQAAFPEYGFYGVGRDDGKTAGEYAGIYYRNERFRHIDAGSLWLSGTPETPGTTFHTKPGAVPRIASWVKLLDKPVGRELLVVNMHWDHESDAARQKSAGLVRERLPALCAGGPAIVMGDFNTTEESPALTVMRVGHGSDNRPLADSFRQVHPQRGADEATFNNWSAVTAGSRIDFILTTDELQPTAAEIVRTAFDGLLPSDHYPVTARLRWRITD